MPGLKFILSDVAAFLMDNLPALEKIMFRPVNRSYLGERLLKIVISCRRLNKLTEQEHSALFNLRDDPTIMIKGVDKGSAVTVLDREDYLKEASKQLENKYVCDTNIPINIIMRALEKIRIQGDLSNNTHDYSLVKDPNFSTF